MVFCFLLSIFASHRPASFCCAARKRFSFHFIRSNIELKVDSTAFKQNFQAHRDILYTSMHYHCLCDVAAAPAAAVAFFLVQTSDK